MASVTRSTGKRGEVKRAAVADNLQAAMERLLERGASFTQISVDALTTEAGIARATFYLHFRDKGELVARLAARVTAEILEASTLRSPETVTRVELRKSVRAVLSIYHRHHAVLAAMVETSAYDADVAQLFRNMMERLIEVNRRTVLRLKQVGRLPADHPPQVAEVVTWAFERSGHQLIRGRSPAQLNAIAGALTHVIWNSIYVG